MNWLYSILLVVLSLVVFIVVTVVGVLALPFILGLFMLVAIIGIKFTLDSGKKEPEHRKELFSNSDIVDAIYRGEQGMR
ncbi:MAG: hypothetical protein U9Q66_03065 [Patescibacteria group bacterium]|nr:hypothetical protein [Patescibacteria group bacterium]